MKHCKPEQRTDYQRPAEALQMAKTAFRHPALGQRETYTLAEVLFDSFLQPVVEGVRSTGAGARQIHYRADTYQIDLQIEAGSGRNKLVIIGQVHDSSQPKSSGRDVSVSVVISDLHGDVALATTDRFGVFRKEVHDSGDLELFFPTLTDKVLTIALRDPHRPLPKEKRLRVVRRSAARRKTEKKT